MQVNQEYLDAISKKLDTFNKLNGVDPEQKKMIADNGFDPFDHMGKSALKYLQSKSEQNSTEFTDPNFRNHNNY
jgi:hypothetical protein